MRCIWHNPKEPGLCDPPTCSHVGPNCGCATAIWAGPDKVTKFLDDEITGAKKLQKEFEDKQKEAQKEHDALKKLHDKYKDRKNLTQAEEGELRKALEEQRKKLEEKQKELKDLETRIGRWYVDVEPSLQIPYKRVSDDPCELFKEGELKTRAALIKHMTEQLNGLKMLILMDILLLSATASDILIHLAVALTVAAFGWWAGLTGLWVASLLLFLEALALLVIFMGEYMALMAEIVEYHKVRVKFFKKQSEYYRIQKSPTCKVEKKPDAETPKVDENQPEIPNDDE